MRIKRLFLLAFLTFLYIAPLVFISSYGPPAIPAQQNTNKDFVPSIEYYETIELADYGEDQDENYDPNYVKTQVLDNDAFEEVGIDIEIWFEIDVVISGFSYASYLYATSQDDCNIGFYNFDTTSFDNFGEPLPTSYDWMNGSVYGADYWNTTHIGCQLSEVGIGDANFFWDYSELTLMKPTEWYDESWLYRKSISVTGSAGAGSDYQVNLTVPYTPHMQSDFDDLRFTSYDGVTEWDYWIETYTASTTATVWVEWRDSLNSDSKGWMYYGNSEVSTTSDGNATFDFYEDWTSETIGAQWTIENSAGSVSFSAGGATHGSIIKVEGNAGFNAYSFYSDNDFTKDYALRFRANLEKTVASDQIMKQGWNNVDGLGQAMIESYQGTQRVVIRDDGGTTDHQIIGDGNFDTWHVFDSTRDGTNTQWLTDGAEVAEGNNAPDALGYNIYVYVRDSEYDLYNDWFVSRKFIVSEPVLDSFGDEEPLYPPDWQTVGIAEFIFIVAWDPAFQFGYDAFFIFLGLIMIPISTMYLVKGGRSEMSSDKLFYGIVIFALGIGFLIGGILP